MIHSFLQILKKLIGKKMTRIIRPLGHGLKTLFFALYYRFPAYKLTIIGITGTKGKTSTTIYTGRLLNASGIKTGYISTALISTGRDNSHTNPSKPIEIQNPFKMTSVDGRFLQKYLREMVDNGCTHVVLEMSSQGLEQNRHWGLGKFDIGVFLNIFPEHIEAHGSWENYLRAKGILFKNLKKKGVFVADSKDKNKEFMWNQIQNKESISKILIRQNVDYTYTIQKENGTVEFSYKKNKINAQFNAPFEAVNSAFALKVVELITNKAPSQHILDTFSDYTLLPGRMQWVSKFNHSSHTRSNKTKYIDVLVDYAHEPQSCKELLEQLSLYRSLGRYKHVIHILSSDGAGRDDWKKPIMGDLSYSLANFTVLTTDNYTKEDNPRKIIDLLSTNFDPNLEQKKYIKEIDREKAFKKAYQLAQKLDSSSIIVSTGVGNEIGLTQPNGIIEWNEVSKWLEIIKLYSKTESKEGAESNKNNTTEKKSKNKQENKKMPPKKTKKPVSKIKKTKQK